MKRVTRSILVVGNHQSPLIGAFDDVQSHTFSFALGRKITLYKVSGIGVPNNIFYIAVLVVQIEA